MATRKGSLWLLFAIVVALIATGTCGASSAPESPSSSSSSGSGLLQLVLDTPSEFSVLMDGNSWLHSGSVSFRAQGTWFTNNPVASGDVLLLLVNQSTTNGVDDFGNYQETSCFWQAEAGLTGVMYVTSIRTYSGLPNIIVFYQNFLGGISELTNVSASSNIEISSSFPSFDLDFTSDTPLRWLTYYQNMAGPSSGIWSPAMRRPFNNQNDQEYQGGYPGGAVGGTPLVLFDGDLNTIVLSPLSNFMVGLQTVSPHSGEFACGLQGMLDAIPLPFSHSSILVAGTDIASTLEEWGSLLLARKGKVPKGLQADVLTTYLGYWTDNGGFYYYVTEPNKTYADTMVDVSNYIDTLGLPVRYYQFDSWWYFKGINNGVKLWEPMSSIFPDGMAKVTEEMGTVPLALHNRYFSPDNDYIQNYTFVVESNIALPLDEEMFVYIMSLARTWGLEVYEQDWLITTYLEMHATQNNVTNAAQWLLALGNAAQRVGITVQFCMPLPMHLLQSTELPAVTQARASNDYQPGNSQWRLAATAMLHWSLGIVPFKDNFYSNSELEEGCNIGYPYGCQEPNSELQTLVASLSAGPVGPSDKISMLNVTRIMQTCRGDGLLLKPDRPAYLHSFVFLNQFAQNVTWLDDLWHTLSYRNEGYSWNYILAANLTSAYSISPADLGLNASSEGVVFDYHSVYNSFMESGMISSDLILPFDASNTLDLMTTASDTGLQVTFEYWIVAPVLDNGWVLLGEIDKHIVASAQRFAEISTSSQGGLLLGLVGGEGETVNLGLIPPSAALASPPSFSNPFAFSCTLSSLGEAKVECSAAGSCICVVI